MVKGIELKDNSGPVNRPGIAISVREFATPLKRRGHIDTFSGYDWGQAQTGTEIHSLIAARHLRDVANFKKEVSLSGEFFSEPFTIQVKGRVDGVFEETDADGVKTITLEEIKSTASIAKLKEALDNYPEHPYHLQIKIYGYLYFLTHGVWPKCRLRLVSNLDQSEELLPLDATKESFEQWLPLKLQSLVKIEIARQNLFAKRKQFAANLEFPYSTFRKGQSELVAAATEVFTQGINAMIQAPTGLGKTIGIMYPALQNALSRSKQLFYVTPKNSQHVLAEKTLTDINAANRAKQNFDARSITLTAKKKICMKDEPLCTPEHCEYARNYHDKVSENDLLEKLQEYNYLGYDTFKKFAKTYEVCPFELSLQAATDVDVVIADYNYVFSPRAAMLHLILGEDGEPLKQNLVIDECHQLFARACDYFSPEISQRYLEELLEQTKTLPQEIRRRFKKLVQSTIAALKAHAPSTDNPRELIKVDFETFQELLHKVQKLTFDYFQQLEKLTANDPVISFQNYIGDFYDGLLQDGAKHFVTYRRFKSGDSIKITCCDAALHLQQHLRWFHSAVGFSATLKPFDYYSQLSGFSGNDCRFYEFASPFPRHHRKVMVIPQVSTKLRNRQRSTPKIAEAINRITRVRPGNYFVFFPSYDFLEKTSQHIETAGFDVMLQTPQMTRAEVESIIDLLCSEPLDGESKKNYLVLAVQGGLFAEGVDYPGDALIGSFIVGPGLPNFELERELLKNYYERNYGAKNGYAFAYVYPAMTKVIQAAGRVIRTEEDRGLIVLLDDRFCDPQYAGLMPKGWYENSVGELVSKKILAEVEDFWTENAT